MSRILPLPQDVIAQIRSSKNITSLQGVAVSLLENSLDADANKVEITLDFSRGDCIVEDNGKGIAPDEFLEHGGLGKPYYTSKLASSVDQELHGCTGTYLASLATLSLLTLTSCHAQHKHTATITFYQNRVISREISARLSHGFVGESIRGTRVTVRDLFGNIPVRVKQRSLALEKNNADEKAWQELKRVITALLLSWRQPCSVRVHDAAGPQGFHLAARHPSVNALLTEKSLGRLLGQAIRFGLKDVLPILFQAGLAPQESRDQWIPVSASSLTLSVAGAVCLIAAPTKRCQFISLGVHPCDLSGYNDLYAAVNKVFSSSSFGHDEYENDAPNLGNENSKRDRSLKSHDYTQKQLRGGKGVDRWPMFFVNISFKNQSFNPLQAENMSHRAIKAIQDVVEAAMTEWLKAHNFHPKKRSPAKKEMVSTSKSTSNAMVPKPYDLRRTRPQSSLLTFPPTKRAQTAEELPRSKRIRTTDLSGKTNGSDRGFGLNERTVSSYFNTWSRIKSGNGTFYDEAWRPRETVTAPAGQNNATANDSREHSEKVVFDLPEIEAGAMSSTKRNPNTIPLDSRDEARDGSPDHSYGLQQRDVLDSCDDFGSCDSSMMLAAEILAENANQANVQAPSTENNTGIASTITACDSDHGTVAWKEPTSNQTYEVDARTGFVLPSKSKAAPAPEHGLASREHGRAAASTQISTVDNSLRLATRFTTAVAPMERKWLPGFLKEWDNPVFAPQEEESIRVTSFDGVGLALEDVTRHRCTKDAQTKAFAQVGLAGSSQLSRDALRSARTISQVDQKYILCKLNTNDTTLDDPVLVLIDQHAASERVMLESLLDELCIPPPETTPAPASALAISAIATTLLPKPLRYEISAQEHQLLRDHAQHFADWGILYDLRLRQEAPTPSQVRPPRQFNQAIVSHLPSAIAERSTAVPKMLIDLLRLEIWTLADAGKPNTTSRSYPPTERSISGKHDWLAYVGTIPKNLLDMLNSRACRSAIMFNDVLPVAQCERLLKELAETKFPFMCAHGRVSVVPIVKLGPEDREDAGGVFGGSSIGVSENQSGFVDAFRKWRDENKVDVNMQ